MPNPRARSVALAAALTAGLLGVPVLVGVVVNNAADTRIRELLVRADTVASHRDVDISAVNRLRNDTADALGDADCSERVIRLLRRSLPEGWSVQEVTPSEVRLTTPSGSASLDCRN